ncbi:TRAP transporter small permease [Rhizobium halophytocola]|uniref:TRAP transporter small permease protein n=1 Tax=Rhizobium halophytocola TaxID=735519 RepID=A0ABS4E483_9HYPH|nr:TRAP transporter small permease [Rhizobium halophytocola]MBP1852762.1 TRAP-type C4-dicarboxylate transport system permease small subunit [Rhizobium halophytocola]
MNHDSAGEYASAGSLFDVIAAVTKIATAVVLISLVLLVAAEVISRSLFNYSLGFVEEVSGYCVVMLTFFGAAIALRAGSLFQVRFIIDVLPEGLQAWMARIFALLALVICAVMMMKTNDLMMSSFTRGKFAPTVLNTPLWIPQLLMPSGFAVIGVFLIEQFLLTFNRFKSNS